MHCRQKAGHLLLSVSVNPTHSVVPVGSFHRHLRLQDFPFVQIKCIWVYMLAHNVDRAGNNNGEEMGLVINWSDDEKIGFWDINFCLHEQT